MTRTERVVIASRCSWTTYNFRRDLILELQRAGTSVVACGGGGDGYEERLRELNITFIPLPLGRGSYDLWSDFRYFIACYRLLRRLRPQVFHAFTIRPVIFGSLAAALARVPVRIAMITGLGHTFTSSRRVVQAVVMRLYRFALRRVHLVYFQNADDRETFLRLGIVTADRVRMIAGSGVDTVRFAPQVRSGNSNEARFVMVARALREKGVAEYLAAAQVVRSRQPDASFTLIGGADDRNPTSLTDDEVRKLTEQAGVRWVGHVEDVRGFLAEADVVVLPSYREGTPMSLLEAAAMAKPMIATRVPGCMEVVRDGFNGWLVPPRDNDALAAAMLTAMTQRDRWVEYGENARDLVVGRFDSRIVCQQMIEDYRDLIRRNAA